MPLTEFKQGAVMCREGEALRQILIITKGTAEASFNGNVITLEKGDTVGVCDLSSGLHSFGCVAATDVTVYAHPCEDFGVLDTLLQENADVSDLLVNSMSRLIAEFMRYRTALNQEVHTVYESVLDIYAQYESLGKSYGLSSKKLPGLQDMKPFSHVDPIEDWVHGYYIEIAEMDTATLKAFFHGKARIASGFLRRGAEDAVELFQVCKVYQDYLRDVSKYFLSGTDLDLFGLISELHFSSLNFKGADDKIGELMAKMTDLLSGMVSIDKSYYQKRLGAYMDNLEAKRAAVDPSQLSDAPEAGPKQNLSDSLEIILDYSECSDETRNRFARGVREYTKITDRNNTEDGVHRLCRELTLLFNEIYELVFFKSLKDENVGTIIKMFLNFGYVDASLAGHENADYLYSITDSFKGDPALGVYTISEWLHAVYTGKKEPSRNELDTDYDAFIHEMKQKGKIDAKEEARLLRDLDGKLRFELENMFPVVNRVTSGRIATFCPILADNNVLKKIDESIVYPANIKSIIDDIKELDFSVFFRETMYSSPELGVAKELINVEMMPDFILMPNAGSRGIMWQEIEGRKRTTPSRMFLPVMMEDDLRMALIRLAAEFRWEMCKRVQGVRWNDIADPSLTSEYFDYLQFYRNNRDLSLDVKTSIKTELMSHRNNYKTVFVSNYVDWLIYESKGSTRLNRYVRKILLTYCPFAAEVRERLLKNPQFSEALNRFNFKQQQRLQRLERLVLKITQSGKTPPKEILEELEYVKK